MQAVSAAEGVAEGAADGVTERAAEVTGLAYIVAFETVPPNSPVADAIEEISRLRELSKEKVASLVGLQRRADEDVEKITSLLRSKGYYSARVSANVDADKSPVGVTVTVNTGPVYPIMGIEIENAAGTGPAEPIGIEHKSLGIDLAAPGEAGAIAGAKPKLLRALEDRSFAFAKVVGQRVVVDHDARGVFVHLTIDTGPPVRFGDVTVEGNVDVETNFILRRVSWAKGAFYSRKAVDLTRQKLSESGLFSGVTISNAENRAADGTVAMKTLSPKERSRRLAAVSGIRRRMARGSKPSGPTGTCSALANGFR